MCQGPKGESAASGKLCFNLIYCHLWKLGITPFFWSKLMFYFVSFSLFEINHTNILFPQKKKSLIISQMSSIFVKNSEIFFLTFSLAFPTSSVEVSIMWSPTFAVAVPNMFETSGPFQTFCWFAIISFPNLFHFLTCLLTPDLPALKISLSNSPFSLVLYSRIRHIVVLQYLRKTRNVMWCFSLLCNLPQRKMLTKSKLLKVFQGSLKSFVFEILLTSSSRSWNCKALQGCFSTGIKIVDTSWICS